MWRSTMPYGRKGLAVQAISAVDLALWDLCGKVRGEPIYQLLGGNTKPGRLPVYATTVRYSPGPVSSPGGTWLRRRARYRSLMGSVLML